MKNKTLNKNYLYQLRLCYGLSELNIGHTEPSESERRIWAVEYLERLLNSNINVTKFLKKEYFSEGLKLPLKY